MSDGLQLTQRAVDLFRSIYGGKSTKGLCQQFDGYYWQWAYQGNEDGIVVYGSAKLAADASVMFTTSINDPSIQPGDLLYWHYVDGKGNNYGHVCTVVGRDDAGRVLVSNTATTGDAYKTLTNDVKISRADTLNLTFRGASHTNGRNRQRTGVTAWPQAALTPTQRQVRAGVQARRRIGAPSTSAPSGDPILEAGAIGNFDGWVYGETVEGNSLWYVGISGDFFWSGSFTEVSSHDLKDMNPPAPVAGNQRQVLSTAPANQRAAATTSSPTVTQLAPNLITTFDGWINGDVISGNGVWFREESTQLYSWSGGFTDTGVHDLVDLNPKASERTVAGKTANVRTGPYTSEAIVSTLTPAAVVPVTQYVVGEAVDGIYVWYVVPGGFAWAGGFTSQSVDGLTKINTPPPSGGVIDPIYKTFKRDSALATWIGSPNYNWRAPRALGAAPTHITMHWMAGTLAGTDAQFQKYTEVRDGVGNGSASNYGIGQTAIHQYVREQDYQQADGNQDSNRWGLSIEHEGSDTAPVTQAVMDLSAALLVEIAKRWGWTEYRLGGVMSFAEVTQFAAANPTIRLVFPHKHWVATSCPGTLDYPAIVKAANKLLAPTPPDPKPEGIVLTREFVQAQADLWNGLLE